MKANYWYYVIITTLHLFSLVSAASRSFALYEGAHQRGQVVMSLQAYLYSEQVFKSLEVRNVNNEKTKRGLRSVGSRPPNCEHRCGDCKPCVAVQMPARTTQYANYEPEGWKCICGASLSTP